MQTLVEAHKNIEEVANENSHNDLRVITEMENRQMIRQGDIYVEKVESIPEGYTEEVFNLQLVDGSTKGSRHVVEKTASLRLFKKPDANALQGPAISTKEHLLIKHPEHADFKLLPGNYVVTYQQNYAQAELTRVKD